MSNFTLEQVEAAKKVMIVLCANDITSYGDNYHTLLLCMAEVLEQTFRACKEQDKDVELLQRDLKKGFDSILALGDQYK